MFIDNKIQVKLIQKTLKQNKTVAITVTGNSMLPLIEPHQKVTITPTKFSNIKLYDIVAIKHDQSIIIHQCIFKSKKYLITHGINNNFIDPPTKPNQILGTIIQTKIYLINNMFHANQLNQLSKLTSYKIPFLLLKGASWQKNFFGYYLNRPTADIDISVKKEDYPLIKKTLLKQKYRIKTIPWLNQKRYQQKIPTVSEISFFKNHKNFKLEFDIHLHTIRCALNPFFTHPISRQDMVKLDKYFWKTAKQIKKNIFVLEKENLLFYFCMNSVFHHALHGLKPLVYIASLIDKKIINWDNFWHLAKKYQVNHYIYYPLVYTKLFFKVKIPKLDQHRPNLIQRILIKPIINRKSIFTSLRGEVRYQEWLVTKSVTWLRLILL
ncbi:hypothetical protein DRH14_03155 [Candidatus Shapirobacteria bacterium]|nr:MAG: hypothetical protein DRH14_03155 [Candidatus Shapirobacteria bacterium]